MRTQLKQKKDLELFTKRNIITLIVKLSWKESSKIMVDVFGIHQISFLKMFNDQS